MELMQLTERSELTIRALTRALNGLSSSKPRLVSLPGWSATIDARKIDAVVIGADGIVRVWVNGVDFKVNPEGDNQTETYEAIVKAWKGEEA